MLIKPRRIIGPEATLRAFATMLRGRTGNEPTPVIGNDAFLGLIDRTLLRVVPQGYWDVRTVAETMLSAQHMDAIAPTTPVSLLILRLIQVSASAQSLPLPVVQTGRLLGLIDSQAMFAFLELEDEFGLFERETAEIDALHAALQVGPGAHVLDIGSGTGGPAIYLAQQTGCHVTGIHSGPVQRAQAAAASAELTAQVHFVAGDIFTAHFPERAFDAIISRDAFVNVAFISSISLRCVSMMPSASFRSLGSAIWARRCRRLIARPRDI